MMYPDLVSLTYSSPESFVSPYKSAFLAASMEEMYMILADISFAACTIFLVPFLFIWSASLGCALHQVGLGFAATCTIKTGLMFPISLSIAPACVISNCC